MRRCVHLHTLFRFGRPSLPCGKFDAIQGLEPQTLTDDLATPKDEPLTVFRHVTLYPLS